MAKACFTALFLSGFLASPFARAQEEESLRGTCAFELSKLSSLKNADMGLVCHRPEVTNPEIAILLPNRGDCIYAMESARDAAKAAEHIRNRNVSFSGIAGMGSENGGTMSQACAFQSAQEMAVKSNIYVNESLFAGAKALEQIAERTGLAAGILINRRQAFAREVERIEQRMAGSTEAQRKLTFMGYREQIVRARSEYPKIEGEMKNALDCQKKARRLLDIVFKMSAETKDKLTSPPMIDLLPPGDREKQRTIAVNANSPQVRSELAEITKSCLDNSLVCKGAGNVARRTPLISVIFGALAAGDADNAGLSFRDQLKTFVNGVNPVAFVSRFSTSTDKILEGKSPDLCGKALK